MTFLLHRLLEALSDKDPGTEHTIRRLIDRYGLTEGDLAYARECATGPGVRSPSRVAIAVLVKRGEERTRIRGVA